MGRKAFQKVTLLRRLNHLLTPDGLLTLYKAQIRPIMEYVPSPGCPMPTAILTCRTGCRGGQNASSANLLGHLPGHQQPWQQQQQRQAAAAKPAVRDSLEHRQRVAALTVLHKAQIQQMRDLETAWRRSERNMRTVLSNDSLLEVSRSHSSTHQRSFSTAIVVWWNGWPLSTQ